MGFTIIDLYRMGNASGSQMDNVRIRLPDPDIDTYTDVHGDVWLRSGTGGMSTWDAPTPGLRGKSWRIPAGTIYSDRLRVWTDEPGHWLWEPTQDMRLSEFKADLAAINQFAQVV